MVQVHLGPPYQRSFLLRYGDLAQLVEHLLCKQGVRGSIPLVSTWLMIQCRQLLKRPYTPQWATLLLNYFQIMHQKLLQTLLS